MSNFGIYGGKDFLELDLKPREWLVENLIREGDSVMFVGNEKSGKSLFIFQLICSLTTCHPFIDKYTVPKACKVTYIQLEGELSDSQDRMKRMIKTQEINPDLLTLMYYPPLSLQERHSGEGLAAQTLCETIEKTQKPDVLIIDPLYFAFMGSLSDDEIVRQFIGNLRIIKDRLGCAVILVHHTHKAKFDYAGTVIDEGDEATFGSKFLKAWADHTLLFIYDKKRNIRILSCNTQRSGDIVKECNLKLIEPEPLYFEITEDHALPGKDMAIVTLLQDHGNSGMTADDIIKQLAINPNVFYRSVKQPLIQGIITKTTGRRPVIYQYKKQETPNVKQPG